MTEDTELLRLRALRTSDEHVLASAHQAFLAEGFEFGIGYRPGMPWEDYLRAVSDNAIGVNLPAGWVPNTFLVADIEGTVVGRTSVRHTLNDALRQYGGHIGFAVLPEHRRRGYGTQILRQSVKLAHTIGIEPVLVTCDDDNVGSIKVIEACGGRLETTVVLEGRKMPTRHYWIA